MTLEQQVCSLDLAKKLKELGVKQESIINWQFFPGWGEETGKWELRHYSDFRLSSSGDSDRVCSAFTVAELGEMLPHSVNVGTNTISYWDIRQRKWRNDGNPLYEIYFDSYLGVPEAPQVRLLRDHSEADARATMLVYLLENKLITLP